MAVINTTLRRDLQETLEYRYLDGSFFAGDNQGNQINVIVTTGEDPATISGSVSALVTKADGSTVTVTGGTISGNVASISIPSNALNIPGKVNIEVKLTQNSTATTLVILVAYIFG